MSCTSVGFSQGLEGVVCPEQTIETRLELNLYQLSADKKRVSIQKKNFRERYKRIAKSDWFKRTHSGMSMGEVISIDE